MRTQQIHRQSGWEMAQGIGAGYCVVLSRILQMDFAEFRFHALGE
jgi:hypothetical protein